MGTLTTDSIDLPADGQVIEGELVPAGGAGLVVPARPVMTLPDLDEWRKLEAYARTVANSGLVGRHLARNVEACMAVILKGRELRLPPMESMHSVFIIEGTPTLRAATMQAVIVRETHKIRPMRGGCDDEHAIVLAQRREVDGSYSEPVEVEWTYGEAQRAGLVKKDNWKNYPGDMLFARAVSRAGRRMFSDVLMGCVYVPEELGAEEVNGQIVVPGAHRNRKMIAAGYDAPASGSAAAAATDSDASGSDDLGPMPDREGMDAELAGIAASMGKSVAQLTTRWAAVNKKNITDATDEELWAFLAQYRQVAPPTPPETQGPAPAETTAEAPPQEPDPHPFQYNVDGDNDFCDTPGCGQTVDAFVHAPQPGPGQESLL